MRAQIEGFDRIFLTFETKIFMGLWNPRYLNIFYVQIKTWPSEFMSYVITSE
jgi:hypothetical protein